MLLTALQNKYQQMYDKEMDALNKQLSALESWKSASIPASCGVLDASFYTSNRCRNSCFGKEPTEREGTEGAGARIKTTKINQMRSGMEMQHNEENKKQIQKEIR